MVDVIALSGRPVKSQQIDDAELTVEQRRDELLHQYRTKPLVFLERYQAHIGPQHLDAFSHLSEDPRAQHYCREVQRRAAGRTDKTRLRNQRYAALRALQRGSLQASPISSSNNHSSRCWFSVLCLLGIKLFSSHKHVFW